MPAWILVLLLALVVIIQVTWLPLIPIFGFKPDLALILVTSWGLLAPVGEAAQWGFVAGVFLDLTSGLPFGLHTLTLTVIGLLVGLGQLAFFRGNIIAPPVTMVLATILDHVLILGIMSMGSPINWGDYLLHITLPVAILNTIASLPIYFLLQFLQRRFAPHLQIDVQ